MINQIVGRIEAITIRGGLSMNCNNESNCQNIIYQSGDTTLNFILQNCDGSAFNISSATELVVLFATLVNPPVILKLSMSQITLTNGGAGQFSCIMSKANAQLLQLGLINVEVRVTIGGETTVAEITGQLTVVASLFPGY